MGLTVLPVVLMKVLVAKTLHNLVVLRGVVLLVLQSVEAFQIVEKVHMGFVEAVRSLMYNRGVVGSHLN